MHDHADRSFYDINASGVGQDRSWRVALSVADGSGGRSKRDGVLKPSPFVKDVATTLATSLLTGAAFILATRLAATRLGPDSFGAFSIARQVALTGAPVVSLGLALALTRFVAGSTTDAEQRRFFLGAVSIGLAGAAIAAGSVVLGASVVTRLMLGRAGSPNLAYGTALLLFGVVAFELLFGYYRGRRKILRANVWELIAFGSSPFMIGLASGVRNTPAMMLTLLSFPFLLALAPLLSGLGKGLLIPRAAGGEVARRLLRFAVPRVPAGFLLGGMFAVGPLVAARVASVRQAGFLATGQVILSLAEAGLAPFGFIALPHIAALRASGAAASVPALVGDVVAFVVDLGLFACVHLFIWADVLTTVWLGDGYRDAIPLMRILSLAIPPYLAYAMLRSVVDAVEDRAVNTRNLIFGFGVTASVGVTLGTWGLGARGLAIGTVCGFFALAGATVRFLVRNGWATRLRFETLTSGVTNIVFASAAVLVHIAVASRFAGLGLLAVVGVFELSALAGFILTLRRSGVRWTVELSRRIFP